MKRIFADTGYWIALTSPLDTLHEKALHITKQIQNCHIYTSEWVIIEFLNDSCHNPILKSNSIDCLKYLRTNRQIHIIPHSIKLFDEGMMLFEKYKDKTWSIADCISFAIMRELEIIEALAYDHHYSQAGFIPLLRY